MSKKIFVFYLMPMLLFYTELFSQYNNIKSSGVAPWLPEQNSYQINSFLTNPNSAGYAYYPVGLSGSQLFRFSVGAPSQTSVIGSVKPYLLGNGDFANPTGIWKFYVQDQNAPPYTIFEVDTATGNLTNVGYPLNLKSGHKPMDMEWDQTTNSFYMVSSDSGLTETQFYRMYWPTKELTWVGPPVTAPASIVAGGFNANGTYFGIDIISSALWKINKNTGAWTQVGTLNYPVNFSQDAGFDRGDYSKLLWCANGDTLGLYEIDTANARKNLIGVFPSYNQVMAVGFVSVCGPQIFVNQLPNTQNLTGPYVVNAIAVPGCSGIAYTKLYWSRNNFSVTDSVNMTNTGGNNWSGNIPGNGNNAVYRYYCKTVDSLNKSAKAPIGAPAALYSFIAMGLDTSKPVIVHTPIGNTSKDNWPVVVNASVTDNFGLDSVWVIWRRNSTTAKEFKLLNSTGNNFSAYFNSLKTDVFYGDTIYYRIFAQDNSAYHNKDSTSMLNFKILAGAFACIGNGTAQISFCPFNTSYYGSRNQIIWTSNDILSGGGSPGFITKIGFDIGIANTQVMNNFSVKMQTVSDTVVRGFVNNNWTVVYAGSYSVPASGWQFINFQTPFEWNGTGSLLVEICFENNTNSMYSTAKGYTTNSSKICSESHDLSSACTAFQSPGFMNLRPNVCFKIDILNPVFGNSGNTPPNYKLSQNYPNPFNPVTRISYDIAKQGFVTLKIYDILGREMNELVRDFKSPGSYSIDFNASGLPSGIYLYRIESEGYIDTKRMILIK